MIDSERVKIIQVKPVFQDSSLLTYMIVVNALVFLLVVALKGQYDSRYLN